MKKYNKDILRKLQLTEIEILGEIERICNEHNIKFCLTGGTLLGAVRHKGFIPWDDDIDIAMSREDFEKFCDICKTKLSKNYYLHYINTDNKYWLTFAKVRKNNTLLDEKNISHLNVKKGIYVDIFPLDAIQTNSGLLFKVKSKLIKLIQIILVYKIGINFNKNKSNLVRILLFAFPIKFFHKICNYLMTLDSKKKNKYIVNYSSIYNVKKELFPYDCYFPFVNIEFEGKTFYAPNKYKEILSQVYGDDYMKLPPKEKRITHNPVRLSFDLDNPNEMYVGGEGKNEKDM